MTILKPTATVNWATVKIYFPLGSRGDPKKRQERVQEARDALAQGLHSNGYAPLLTSFKVTWQSDSLGIAKMWGQK